METDRQLLLSAACRLFHERGVNVVSLEEILQASEVSHEQFGRHYASKEDLVADVVELQMNRVLSTLEPYVNEMQTWEDLEIWGQGVLRLNEIAGLLGCPVGVIALDATPQSHRALQAVQRALNRWGKMHVKALKRLKERGVFVESFEPERAVQFAGAVIQGALLLGRAYQNSNMLERNFSGVMTYLETFRATRVPSPT